VRKKKKKTREEKRKEKKRMEINRCLSFVYRDKTENRSIPSRTRSMFSLSLSLSNYLLVANVKYHVIKTVQFYCHLIAFQETKREKILLTMREEKRKKIEKIKQKNRTKT